MKKIYFLTLVGLFNFTVNGQIQIDSKPAKNLSPMYENSETIFELTPKSGGDIVWQNNFNTPSDWTINNSGQTAASFGWDIGSTSQSWWTAQGILSTSGGNYAELGNGNPTTSPATQALGVTYTLTSSTPISIATNYLELSFEQFGARFNDAQEVFISTDNITWIKVGDNSNFPVLSSSGGAAYPNSSLKTINLSNFIPAASTQIWVRFSWTTAYPASASNPNVWVTYGWFIDDVMLTELFQNDLKLDAITWGFENQLNQLIPYYKIPSQQVRPIYFGGTVSNQGTIDRTDAVFKATVNSTQQQSIPSTVIAGTIDTIYTANGFTPPLNLGILSANAFEIQTALDEVPTNNFNSSTVSFEITNSVYARDNGVKTSSYSDVGYKLCNQFDFSASQAMLGIDAFIDLTSSLGKQVHVELLADDLQTVLASSSAISLVAGDLGTVKPFNFTNPFVVSQNYSYLACIVTEIAGTSILAIGNAGQSEAQTSFLYDETDVTWYYTLNTPMVRARMDCPTVNTSNPQIINEGETYTIGTSSYTTAGNYTDVFQNIYGCDSIVTTQLTVIPLNNYSNPQSICAGDSYSIGTNIYTVAGTYTDVLQDMSNADSTVITILTVNPVYNVNNVQAICAGESYTIGNSSYSSAGTYTNLLQSIHGCDSTVTTILTVNPISSSTNPQTICTGGSYSIGNSNYTAAGTYTNVLQSSLGCDSTVTTILTVNNPTLNNAVTVTGTTITATETGSTYQWLDCNNSNAPISGATSQSYTATTSGNYAVRLTSTVCPNITATSTCSTINIVGIEEINQEILVNIFPNPANDFVRVELIGAQIDAIQVMDLNGKILSESLKKGAGAEINISGLSAGVYLLNIQSSAGEIVKRFVKM